MTRNIKVLFILLLAVNIFFSAWPVLRGDINFHTDIARDFLAVEDIARNHHITLIGPRAGGISGVFHGPLWFYLMVPAFIIGNGNPVVIGVFWLLLSFSLLSLLYWVTKKIFNSEVALLATVLLSSIAWSYTNALFNPFGAVLLSPLFLYLFWQYVLKKQFILLVASLFVLGLIIQFQMAFGVPVLVASTVYLFYFLFKEKKLWHILAFGILIIPLSTFILFEVRHDFLQVRAVLDHISGHGNAELSKLPWMESFLQRIKGIFMDGINVALIGDKWWLGLSSALSFIYILFMGKTKSKKNIQIIYLLFLIIYSGFWTLTFLYKGVIWGYYFWPFLPLVVMFFAAGYEFIPKKTFLMIFGIIVFYNSLLGFQNVLNSGKSIGIDGGSWKFYEKVSKDIYDKGDKEFGYFIFTPDQYGYSPRYAMNYFHYQYPAQVFPYQKKPITYLIIAPPPKEKQYLNGNWWRTNSVKITKKPAEVIHYPNGFTVEKYILTSAEQKISADPNLIQDLHFR